MPIKFQKTILDVPCHLQDGTRNFTVTITSRSGYEKDKTYRAKADFRIYSNGDTQTMALINLRDKLSELSDIVKAYIMSDEFLDYEVEPKAEEGEEDASEI